MPLEYFFQYFFVFLSRSFLRASTLLVKSIFSIDITKGQFFRLFAERSHFVIDLLHMAFDPLFKFHGFCTQLVVTDRLIGNECLLFS
jgi:hypothetical protein